MIFNCRNQHRWTTGRTGGLTGRLTDIPMYRASIAAKKVTQAVYLCLKYVYKIHLYEMTSTHYTRITSGNPFLICLLARVFTYRTLYTLYSCCHVKQDMKSRKTSSHPQHIYGFPSVLVLNISAGSYSSDMCLLVQCRCVGV